MDMGGYVIIINAEKVTVTGNKFNDKLYRSHPTAKPGTLKTETFRQLNEVCARWLVYLQAVQKRTILVNLSYVAHALH